MGFSASNRFMVRSSPHLKSRLCFSGPFQDSIFFCHAGLPIYESRSDHSSFAAWAVLRASLSIMRNWVHAVSLGAEIPAAFR
jgi:hypothetical protein